MSADHEVTVLVTFSVDNDELSVLRTQAEEACAEHGVGVPKEYPLVDQLVDIINLSDEPPWAMRQARADRGCPTCATREQVADLVALREELTTPTPTCPRCGGRKYVSAGLGLDADPRDVVNCPECTRPRG